MKSTFKIFLCLATLTLATACDTKHKTEKVWVTKVVVTDIENPLLEQKEIHWVKFINDNEEATEMRLHLSSCYEHGNYPIKLDDTLECVARRSSIQRRDVGLSYPICTEDSVLLAKK